jgi:hypothetical protein
MIHFLIDRQGGAKGIGQNPPAHTATFGNLQS